jgi:hypothetical protein
MTTLATASIGKCKIEIRAIGCVICGAEFASSWHDGRPARVRTYFATTHAIAAMPENNLPAKLHLAFRLQTLREAIEEFLKVSAAGHGAQGDPATADCIGRVIDYPSADSIFTSEVGNA